MNLPAELARIAISPIPDRLGQVVHNHLRDDLTPGGLPADPTHRLEVALVTNREGLGYRRDESITRVNLWLVATYRLIAVSSGKVEFEERARAVASFDVVQSDFSTLTAERDAEDRVARAVSREIALRLASHFESAASRRH